MCTGLHVVCKIQIVSLAWTSAYMYMYMYVPHLMYYTCSSIPSNILYDNDLMLPKVANYVVHGNLPGALEYFGRGRGYYLQWNLSIKDLRIKNTSLIKMLPVVLATCTYM